VRLVFLSTYELGQQPAGLAALAGALKAEGHEVLVADLAVESLPEEELEKAEAVIFSVPMHTATELALRLAGRIVSQVGRLPFAFVGLYAPALSGHELLDEGDLLAAGEVTAAVSDWLAGLSGSKEAAGTVVSLGAPRLSFVPAPARGLLPPLEAYAHYSAGGRQQLSAAVETTRGCNHSCLHCPVPTVYAGRSRQVPLETVISDLDQVVEMGAEHVSFADPDFLNRPRHAMAVAEALASRHPGVSFDATIKVEHLLRHRQLLEPLAAFGLSFVTSAFESTDDSVLALLQKGHTASDEAEAVRALRSAGIELRPSWLPFNPWTTFQSLASLLSFSAEADLVESTDPVQYSIRLLIPAGSLLLGLNDKVLEEALAESGPVSAGRSRSWRHREPALDELAGELGQIAARSEGADLSVCFGEIWEAARRAGVPLSREVPAPSPDLASATPGSKRPRLSEAWFCCAEPTLAQLEAVDC
jgi:hypothetical protein